MGGANVRGGKPLKRTRQRSVVSGHLPLMRIFSPDNKHLEYCSMFIQEWDSGLMALHDHLALLSASKS